MYQSDYLKRDDQVLALRLQNEESRARMTKAARDKDRALAQSVQNGENTVDGDIYADENVITEDAAAVNGDPDANGTKVIVIHPGSQNLRIGLASDALPKTVPMVVARRSPENESEGIDAQPRPKKRRLDTKQLGEPKTLFEEEVDILNADMETPV